MHLLSPEYRFRAGDSLEDVRRFADSLELATPVQVGMVGSRGRGWRRGSGYASACALVVEAGLVRELSARRLVVAWLRKAARDGGRVLGATLAVQGLQDSFNASAAPLPESESPQMTELRRRVRGLSVSFFFGYLCLFFLRYLCLFSFLGLKSQEMASYAQVIE